MTVLYIAVDVVRELIARRVMIALLSLLSLGFLVLALALDLEVVEGALAAGRLFGTSLTSTIVPIDVVMNNVFQLLAMQVFYLGALFGIVATSDIAPTLLSPGRIEALLALPVRRMELVVGTFLGVFAVALMTALFAVGGISAVLFWKAKLFTPAPLVGALMASCAFVPLYGVMLLVASLTRSAAASAGAGLAVFVAGIATSDREAFLGLFSTGFARDAMSLVVAPLPRFPVLADFGAKVAGGDVVASLSLWGALGGAFTFAGACIGFACLVVMSKDY
ncbi:MAG: hypothetical protein ACO3JL_00010 [Myxococcota bacterium]